MFDIANVGSEEKDGYILIEHAIQVIRSCKTKAQCDTAHKYAVLAFDRYYYTLPNTTLKEAFETNLHCNSVWTMLQYEMNYQLIRVL